MSEHNLLPTPSASSADQDGTNTQPSASTQATATGRRQLLRAGLRNASLVTAGVVAGSAGGAAAAHYADTHLDPTDRVAPKPTTAGLFGVQVLFQGPPEQQLACITYDDGPDPRWTPLVLDILAQLNIPATFFVLGEAVQAHPELVAREVAAGHEVGIHNWVHTDVYSVGVDELRGSIDRTIKAITAAGAPSPRLWRPPYGRLDAPALMVAAERDLDVLLWGLNSPSPSAAAAVAQKAGPGAVILCHDGRTQPSEPLLRAMGESLAKLKEQGLRFVTGSQMLAASTAAGVPTATAPEALAPAN
ncbi:Bifunctional xylanase/deacetylase precursor [Actinomyces bovis]|uniref:Bifunctional xylanase/deacetylase n=1 Tax=Actinomyces bovis TaxID=1658 RepID=A0ABY1VK06_9ACTO|nr:polysaccharide deacetylase family protein [Actinomyces bovis]SPT52405.1 Bifunctional xylanase/deacetylase precursor [Actinomyces bovis]VEG54018.1 Bifunctional xylanase/deacetylase precursor [Actinomyces israelii]